MRTSRSITRAAEAHVHPTRQTCQTEHFCASISVLGRSTATPKSASRKTRSPFMQQSNRRHRTVHIVAVDWLVQLLLLMSMLTTVSGLVLSHTMPINLGGRPVRAAVPTMDLEDTYDMWGVSSATQAAPTSYAPYSRPRWGGTTEGNAVVSTAATMAVQKRRHVFPDTDAPETYRWQLRRDLTRTLHATAVIPDGDQMVSTPRDTVPRDTEAAQPERHEALPAKETVQAMAAEAAVGEPASRRLYTDTELLDVLSEHDGRPTVLVFGAKSCRACRRIQPKLERLAASMGARFYFIYHDVSTSALFAQHAITQTPTVQVYSGSGALYERAVYSGADLAHFSSVLDGALAA